MSNDELKKITDDVIRQRVEKRKAYHREYIKKRYASDPDFHNKVNKRSIEYIKKRYATDEDFREKWKQMIRARKKERYNTDIEYREKEKQRSREYQRRKREANHE